MPITRRSFFGLLTAPLVSSAFGQEAKPVPTLASVALPYDQLAVRATQVGQYRAIMKGKLATGEELEMHHTTLNPGGIPHPGGHKHAYAELWFIREGTLEFTVNGRSTRLGPGSVAFASGNDLHSVTNVGESPAQYFVVAVGPGAFH